MNANIIEGPWNRKTPTQEAGDALREIWRIINVAFVEGDSDAIAQAVYRVEQAAAIAAARQERLGTPRPTFSRVRRAL